MTETGNNIFKDSIIGDSISCVFRMSNFLLRKKKLRILEKKNL